MAPKAPPLVRFGLLWTVVLVAALIGGTLTTALVVIPVTVVATASAGRVGVSRPTTNLPLLLVLSGLVPLAAVGGPYAALIAWVVAGSVAAAAAFSGRSPSSPLRSALVVMMPAGAAAAVVVARGQGRGLALVLVAGALLFDAANHLMGTGTHGGPAGTITGMVTVGILAVMVAAVLVPPFTGRSPWIMCGLLAVLAAVGPWSARRLSGPARLPALARLDSLILAGPAWVAGVMVLHLH